MLTISVLGPVEVRRSGQLVAVPAGKTTELLVRLALEPGTTVRSDRLVEELWGVDALATRRNTLQSKVAKLRRALGDPAALVSIDGGYRLAVAATDVDATLVVGNLDAALALTGQGDDAAAAGLCATTRALFRGELLSGAGDGEWSIPHRARLQSVYLHVVEAENGARLRLGEVSRVIAETEPVLDAHPYHEGLWVLLITALYRAGRQADALAAYQRVRALLADELGLEPGPQLRTLEERVLLHAPDLDATLADGVRESVEAPVGNLPTMVTELVGRAGELSEVGSLVTDHRLVEIVGPAGVGKTAIAIAVARESRAPGGAWLARLETSTTADELADCVIAALGVTGGVGSLFERLKRSDTLLVLDNCEHVLDAAAELVQHILDRAPRTKILCTTQASLGVDGSKVVELGPLELADAVELFTVRASVHRGGHVPDESGETIRDVCRALDGLPLAIELAAARTRTLSVAEVARRLDDRFEVLSDPTSRRPERRRALRAAIGWSYELLFPDDQRGLWALSTFVGGATLAAMERVLQALDVPPRTAIDVVGRLAGRSLLIVDNDRDSPVTRYRLLDSIRAFAMESMSDAGATQLALAAHARWFGDLAEESTQGVRSAQQAEHLGIARAERSNIDAALTWCARNDPLLGVSIANGFGWAWVVLGDSRAAQRLLTALDAADATATVEQRVAALLLAGWFETSTGDLELARRHIQEGAALAEQTGVTELQARAAYYLSYLEGHEGDFGAALESSRRSGAMYAGLDRPWDVAANALFATRAAISAGDEALAADAADHARVALAKVDDPWLQVRYEAMLGELARLQHRFDDAVRHLSRAALRSGQLGFQQTEAYQVASLGRAQCQAGDYELGAETLASAVVKAEGTGDVRMAALARVHLGRVRCALGDADGARSMLEQAVAWHRGAGGGEQSVLGESLLAALDAREGVAEVVPRLEAILERARLEENAPAEVFALDALARVALSSGDVSRARSLFDHADARMEATSHFIADRDRVDRPLGELPRAG